MAVFPAASLSPIIPEPTTTVNRKNVARNSEKYFLIFLFKRVFVYRSA
jgi:hypothetical protein